jgi:hypothetical protein
MPTVRIITQDEYTRLTNTATVYRDPKRRAQLANKPLEVLQRHLAAVRPYDKQTDEILVIDIPPEVRDQIRGKLRPDDVDNPEAYQRFAGSWYFAAYRDLCTALHSEICAKQATLF